VHFLKTGKITEASWSLYSNHRKLGVQQ